VIENETQNNNLAEFELKKAKRICGVGEFISSLIFPKVRENNAKGICLEIGCGHGHWLSSYAESDSQNIFVGIDLISKRIRKAERKKDSLKLENLFFLKAEASEFLHALPNDLPVMKTFIMYSDPWPKKRHFKKRLIQSNFLSLLAEKSYNNSNLFFKTDHQGYFDWTTHLIKDSSHWTFSKKEWPHDAGSFFGELFQSSINCSAKIS
jgi:tRNA (guanine-N7-)-methyltransferase